MSEELDDTKVGAEINPDVLDAVFEVVEEDEEVVSISVFDENDIDIDIAFQANDEDYW